jgi:hypothetical protein|nr:MAG TPA: ATP synthase [Caudoviricetes sp.]DAP59172.1 MAG TPA: ATP synthase [Caudoviricetes sp.]
MFQLIWLLFCLPFYILSITVGILYIYSYYKTNKNCN